MSAATAVPSAAEKILAYFRDFGVLRETRREFWGVQLVNLLDNTFYFAMLTIGALFLSHDLGMSDQAAGRVIASYTSAAVISLTFSGAVCDWLGIRRALRLSVGAMLVLRLAVVGVGLIPTLPHRGALVAVLLFLMAPFMASMNTIYQSATKRFTTQRSRSAGFNVWYLVMNLGSAAGEYSIDFVRLHLRVANVHIFTMGVVTAILCLVCIQLLMSNDAQLGGVEESEPGGEKSSARSPLAILRGVAHEPALLRLLVLMALIVGVRAVYTYQYLMMPKYWERTIGPDAAIGALSMIGPVGIVVGLIFFIPLANRFKVLNMLVFGAMVSASSLFCMALPWQIFGVGIAQAHYIMATLCMILLTVGEVIWGPKIYEFTAAIAPKGQEGTYLGLSLLPWFVAKTLVSWFSGDLLQRWSPEKVDLNGVQIPLQQAMIHNQIDYWHTPAAMWLLLGGYAMVSCLIAACIRGWLEEGAHFKNASAAAGGSNPAGAPEPAS